MREAPGRWFPAQDVSLCPVPAGLRVAVRRAALGSLCQENPSLGTSCAAPKGGDLLSTGGRSRLPHLLGSSLASLHPGDFAVVLVSGGALPAPCQRACSSAVPSPARLCPPGPGHQDPPHPSTALWEKHPSSQAASAGLAATSSAAALAPPAAGRCPWLRAKEGQVCDGGQRLSPAGSPSWGPGPAARRAPGTPVPALRLAQGLAPAVPMPQATWQVQLYFSTNLKFMISGISLI